ncbi:helix-turn-helix domain-containing protein [Clostridium estertheticum]|uniref:helix-turn-helix domain-containing protein n=1 Tax=Clostridium estertheticum TaxID=238834 RepID=UPI001C0D7A98|nr:helix-turn-helix transcriptional regulator [Clostridium estertheticum]MBU3075609.1 helix-turn-helix transcriptional regulator [Clostridium estertheticum]MBU3164809.1 helix-turn-helix transcriptional regulator [Clostridium estertheticum]
MGVCYKRLWKLIIDKDITKAQLREASGVAASTFSKMNKNEYVSLEVLARLCCVLDCELSDIVEIVHE